MQLQEDREQGNVGGEMNDSHAQDTSRIRDKVAAEAGFAQFGFRTKFQNIFRDTKFCSKIDRILVHRNSETQSSAHCPHLGRTTWHAPAGTPSKLKIYTAYAAGANSRSTPVIIPAPPFDQMTPYTADDCGLTTQ